MTLSGSPRKWLLLACALLLLAMLKVGMVGWYWLHRGEGKAAAPVALSCRPDFQPCTLPSGGQLRFVTPARNGAPFVIRLEHAGSTVPTAEFSMVGMDMGFNRYRFVADGVSWSAKVTLPVCATGGRDWLMALELNGRRYQLPFHVQ